LERESTRDEGAREGEPSDESLMAEVAAGDRRAFERLSRRHLRRSLALAHRVLGNPADAEEVVQDSFLQVWAHAASWRGDGSQFSTWLYRIVMNRCLDYRRRRTFEPLDEAGEVPAPVPDALSLVADRQIAARVDAAIAALPERQKAALSLCYYGDVGCGEAARILNVSMSAMESLLVRARRTVRSRLEAVIGRANGDEL
jgi:RNA polymerase sigma-70 factor, ECF subfamily